MLTWLRYLLRWLTRANILAHRAMRTQSMHQYIGALGVLSVKARTKDVSNRAKGNDNDVLKLGLNFVPAPSKVPHTDTMQ